MQKDRHPETDPVGLVKAALRRCLRAGKGDNGHGPSLCAATIATRFSPARLSSPITRITRA